MITTVWFETHATTIDNEQRLAAGWLGGDLSPTGRDQAAALGRRIAERRPAAIFSSDLARAVQTLQIAVTQPGVDVADADIHLDRRLRECDYGRLNGAPHEVVHGNRPARLTEPYPDGESWTGAVERARTGVLAAAARYPGRTIVIIGHIATRLACDTLINSAPLEELLIAPYRWQPGRKYELVSADPRAVS